MKNNINEFINFIKEKTSILLSIYDESGKFLSGDTSKNGVIDANFNDTAIDEDANCTLFRVKISGSEYIARIEGVDGYVIKLAKLISELSKTFTEKASELSKKEFYDALLKGKINYSETQRYVKKFAVPDKKCFVNVVVLPEERVDEVEAVLEDYIETGEDAVVKTGTTELVVVRFFADGDNEYKSPTEYGDFLLKSVYEECGIKGSAYAGITVKTPYALSTSYALACEAKDCAEILGDVEKAHSFKDQVLTKAVRELTPEKTDEYLRLLSDDQIKDVFLDNELSETAEEFLNCNLNASETARKLFVHRNTLMYRLDKIERVTGLNVRNFSDAVTFRFMTILYKASKR